MLVVVLGPPESNYLISPSVRNYFGHMPTVLLLAGVVGMGPVCFAAVNQAGHG